MADVLKWKVLRRHEGDRMYEENETRQGTRAELGHLSPNTLELIGPAAFGGKGDHDQNGLTGGTAAKSEPAPRNKAESAAPANKAVSPRASKGK